MSDSLDDTLHEQIVALSEEGDELQEEEDFDGAVQKYEQAIKMLPAPKEQWEAATQLYAALGDAHWFAARYKESFEAFSTAVKCPDGLGNPFVHMRLGETCFELGDSSRADDELTRAYMGAGKDIFEDEDPKYFERLSQILKPPTGQDSL